MTVELGRPEIADLAEVVSVLAAWQDDAAPFQLHPGDVGWLWRTGADEVATRLRTWRRRGELLAVGALDGDSLVRLGIVPSAQHDEELAAVLAADLDDPDGGVLDGGEVAVEVPDGALLRRVLERRGWAPGESWTPLRRSLAEPVPRGDVRVEVVGPDRVTDRTGVHRAAFPRSTFTDDGWRAMAAGPAYAAARCLVAYAPGDVPVAAVTVWSAGPGRPGLLEPMGADAAHRGRGYGRAVTVAAAAALQQLGASSATVCTPSANAAGVATYRSAGYAPGPVRLDLQRGPLTTGPGTA